MIKAVLHIAALYLLISSYSYGQEKDIVADSLKRTIVKNKLHGDYHLAMQGLYDLLSYYQAKGDSSGYAVALLNIGILNYDLEDYQKALDQYEEALQVYTHLGMEIRTAQAINNIGLSNYQLGNLEKALNNFQTAIDIKRRHNMHPAELNYANIGRVYAKMKQYDSALVYYNKGIVALKNYDKERARLDSMELLHDIGQVYLKTNQKQRTLNYLKKSFLLARQVSDKNFMAANARYLTTLYESQNNIDSAFFFSKINAQYADSAFYKKNSKAIARVETRYAIDQINRKNQQDLERRNMIIYGTLTGMGLLVAFTIVSTIQYRKNRKNERLLRLRNEEINKQKISELEHEQEMKTIKANIEGQERERQRIAEELHDGIGGNLSSIKLSLSNIPTSNHAPEFSIIMKRLDETFEEVRTIAHNLAAPGLQTTSFSNLLSQYFSNISRDASFELIYHPGNKEQLDQLPANCQIEVYRIIQEALSNILKHAEATLVEIQFIADKESLNIMIEDNGKGFDLSGTHSGIGLENIRSRINVLRGQVDIDSYPGRGTVINIDISLKHHNNHGITPANNTHSR